MLVANVTTKDVAAESKTSGADYLCSNSYNLYCFKEFPVNVYT